VSIGAMVGPEAFTEVRYLAHAKQMQALELIPEAGRRVQGGLRPRLRRPGPHLSHRGRRDHRRRLGSVLGTIKDVVDEMRDAGVKIGVLGITSFRPFPLEAPCAPR
jgi:pyruvate ferredoxin oxidoreductase alpha subunit